MATFRGIVKGNRSEASRLGTEDSGMVATVNGWECGIRVEVMARENGDQIFTVYRTGGSNNKGLRIVVSSIAYSKGHTEVLYPIAKP